MDTDILFVLHILTYCMKVFKHLREKIFINERIMYVTRNRDSIGKL